MTILFPSIKPSSLVFTPAKYEVSNPEFRDIIVSPRLLASKPNSPTLSLTFRNIDADKILSIFTTWERSYSGFYELTLPSEIVSSITSTEFLKRVVSAWRFTSEPKLSNISAGVGDVYVQLKGVFFLPYSTFGYYRVLATNANGNANSWRSTATYYPAARTIDYNNPPWQLYIQGGTTNHRRELAWPGLVKFCLSGNGAIGGGIGDYNHIHKPTKSVLNYQSDNWSTFYGGISGPSCVTSNVSVSYEFTNDPTASSASYAWAGISS